MKRFFYASAAVLALVIVYHLGANAAGANSAGVAIPNEVAVLTGVLRNGETIPLPTYADGTMALESECHWTVSNTAFGAGNTWCYAADAVYPAALNTFDIADFVNAHPGRVMNAGHEGSGGTYDGNYIIVATRGSSSPTSATRASWGEVKARYAPSRTASPGATSR